MYDFYPEMDQNQIFAAEKLRGESEENIVSENQTTNIDTSIDEYGGKPTFITDDVRKNKKALPPYGRALSL